MLYLRHCAESPREMEMVLLAPHTSQEKTEAWGG